MTGPSSLQLLLLLVLLFVLSACSSSPSPEIEPPLVEGINGRLLTASSTPVEGATIQIFVNSSSTATAALQPSFSGVTNRDGYFGIAGVPAGTYNVMAQKNGLGALATNVTVTEASKLDVTLTAEQLGSMQGQAILEGSQHSPGITVFVPGTSFHATTDETGGFTMSGLPAGTYRLVAQFDGYGQDEATGIQVTSGSTVTLERELILVRPSDDSPPESAKPQPDEPHQPGEDDSDASDTPGDEDNEAPEDSEESATGQPEEKQPDDPNDTSIRCGMFPTASSFTASVSSTGSRLTLQRFDPLGALQAPARYVPGELLVRYQAPVGVQSAAHHLRHMREIALEVQAQYRLTIVRPAGLHSPAVMRIAEHANPETLARDLMRDPRIAYAEPNYYLQPLEVPNDMFYAQQWNMSLFGMPQAWSVETGKSSMTVAVIDTGIDMHHEDFAGRLLPGCDFYDRDNDPQPGPGTHHGTHVAGIVAANGNNGKGVAGVAYTGIGLLPVKVFSDAGSGATLSMVADAIRWSAGLSVTGYRDNPNPAQIINLSLGALGTSHTLNSAVADARNAGALVVAAAGNNASNTQIMTPANAPGTVAVGAVDSTYARSGFSNYSTTGRTVDLMAPGGYGTGGCMYIPSTLNGNTYGCMAGTSMASPFAAGVAALVWSQNPAWTAEQVISRLLDTTYFEPTWRAYEYGNGVICADKALGASTTCGKK
jgi:subtilisin family serine protease